MTSLSSAEDRELPSPIVSPFLEVPAQDWVASNELAFAIEDRFPVSPGHCLVVTKRLTADWWSCTEAEQQALMALVNEVRSLLRHERRPTGFNVGFNAGISAGQTVEHVHVHVIPRYDGDVLDPRGGVRHVIPGLGNYLVPRPGSDLVTTLDGRMKLELLRCLIRDDLDRIDLLVSFVMRSGLDLIASHLDEALARGARVRLLTTDYLGITDPSALGFFLDRLELAPVSDDPQLQVRVFSDPSTSFHPKAYIFSRAGDGTGVAFVGSSNLSRSALERGVEWNIETRSISSLIGEFDRLWADGRARPLDRPWLADYRQRQLDRIAPAHDPEAFAEESPEPAPSPTPVQDEALDALAATRAAGFMAGLVVMATGLGKTWLAAFDCTRPQFRRVLFVAHREEILSQARDVFRRIRPTESFGYFTGKERSLQGDVVFASVQSLAGNLDQFDPEAFDYIVVDEFHHADAPTYRRTIAHFRPTFLLGLTATPERTDRADLLALCADNLVYECGLVEGVTRELLSPFGYRAIRDVADYAEIPWRSGRFDPTELSKRLETTARAQQVLDEWRSAGVSPKRALGFCCSISHATFMAQFFADHGVAAVAVHSGAGSGPRSESLDRVSSGELEVIFTVDLFNEGVDVPAIDTVLLLRPTESPVVFLQQIGRGLRRHPGKEHLMVLDLVGNHRSFLLKARLLAELAGKPNATNRQAIDHIAGADVDLPAGCSIVVDTDVVALFEELLRRGGARQKAHEVVADWADAHGGRRPTALELSILLGGTLPTTRKTGGWFGLLGAAGLLTPQESEAFTFGRSFLSELEFGSYTKSFKLTTVLAMLNAGRLRSGMALGELALGARWLTMRDRRLRNDITDAARSFRNPRQPTESEWLSYWRKNPINAWIGGNRAGEAEPWFRLDDDRFELMLDLGDAPGETFDEMVGEIVEYRLHRYLVSKKRLDLGERRLVHDGEKALDAEFVVETVDGLCSAVLESSGGAAGSEGARNIDYAQGFGMLLTRMGELGARLVRVELDTTRTARLPSEERLLDGGLDYPIDLRGTDLRGLQTSLLRSMSRTGRASESVGGGNMRKRVRFVVDNIDLGEAELADALAFGLSSVRQSVSVGDDVVAEQA